MEKRGNRVAYHEIVMPDGTVYHMGVLTLVDGRVTEVKTFHGELAMTVWRGGTAILQYDEEGRLFLAEEKA